MTTPVTPTTNGTLSNASVATNSLAFGGDGFGPIALLLVYILVALVAAQFVAPWLASSRLLSGVGAHIVQSLRYAIKGIAATAVLALGGIPGYYLVTADGAARGVALEVIGALLGAYVLLTVIGVLADRAVSAFIEAHPEYDAWGDLFPGEESDAEPVADGGTEQD